MVSANDTNINIPFFGVFRHRIENLSMPPVIE